MTNNPAARRVFSYLFTRAGSGPLGVADGPPTLELARKLRAKAS